MVATTTAAMAAGIATVEVPRVRAHPSALSGSAAAAMYISRTAAKRAPLVLRPSGGAIRAIPRASTAMATGSPANSAQRQRPTVPFTSQRGT